MEDDDVSLKENLEFDENSIESVCDRLNSKDSQVVYNTVIQIKNLIIGNNKYKTVYLTDKIVSRLIEIINSHQSQDQSKSNIHSTDTQESSLHQLSIDLINQILIVFSSFSLGNLEHIIILIKTYAIHELLFNIIGSVLSKIEINAINSNHHSFHHHHDNHHYQNHPHTTQKGKQYSRLVDSCLLCLSNMYSSSQLMPKLIYLLDKQLYATNSPSSSTAENSTFAAKANNYNNNYNNTDHNQYHQSVPSNLNLLIKFFHVSNRAKQTVLNIITISSVNLMSTSCFLLRKETSNFKRYRAILIKSEMVKLLAGLLTSFNTKLQLNCLKFYASISFECLEATRQILNTQYYEFGLVDLISSYLSRENQAELQLYAAKCLTNLYRSSLLIENDLSDLMDTHSDIGGSPLKLINNQLIRARTMPALVRLCVRFSTNYKTSFINDTEDPLDSTTTLYTNNLLYLIEAVSTLTYLIELNSDLQQIAGYLEQILPTLIQNILYSFSNILSFRKKIKTIDPKLIFSGESSRQRSRAINKTTNSSLFSLFYLIYNQFTSKGIHLKMNQHQYDLNSYKCSGNSTASMCRTSSSRKCLKFFKMFEINLYKYLISVSLHLMASLASNNEESRRQLTENSELINKIVELIQLKSNKMSGSGGEETNADDLRLTELLENDDCDFDDLLIEYDEEIIEEAKASPALLTATTEANLDLKSNSSLTDSNLLRLSSLCLLHSLSRSVHQLRTKFLDNKLWNTIVELINKIYVKKLKLNEMNSARTKKIDESASVLTGASVGSGNFSSNQVRFRECAVKTASNEEDDEDLLINEIDLDIESDLVDFSLNEKNLIAILFALVANLVIDFSPCKEMLINNNIIKILVEFIDCKNISIKVNSIWTLMNLAYQADQKIKQQILTEISMEKLFQLLTEQDETLVMKTVGLIRNLISYRPHVDYLMNVYGNKIIQAIVMILEGEYYSFVIKEQALCILANIADGATSKEFIMDNEDLLRKINSFMTHNYTELQVTALYCVSNLVNVNDEGSTERQLKLKEMGAHRILQKLLHSNDPILFDKVKSTLQQFSLSNSVSSLSTNTNTSAMI